MKKSKIGLLICVIGLVVAGGVLGFVYMGQLEKTEALPMQTILVNTAIAQEKYYAAHQTYTTEWKTILPQIALPTGRNTLVTAVAGKPEQYLFSFSDNPKDGYLVSLQVNADGQRGIITAVRQGSRWYHYRLERAFPEGETQCLAGKMNQKFCHDFWQATQPLEVKNLVPVQNKP